MGDVSLDSRIPLALRTVNPSVDRRSIPLIAKDQHSIFQIREALLDSHTSHEVILGDATSYSIAPNSVQLVITSPPYWTLKDYPVREGQLGRLTNYEEFLSDLNRVWQNCFDALVTGGRLVCVVGDVCLSRRKNNGRHSVVPLHADILKQCRDVGFDNLSPIIWHKISNVQTESGSGGSRTSYLGKPYEPNGVIKNEIEFILMLRKPGGYRSPSRAARILSVISSSEHDAWFRQIWTDIQGETTKLHPAPFPIALAERLIRMFSFVDDTVFDPFTGTASTQIAAKRCGRNSIGIEVEPTYHAMAVSRLDGDLFTRRG